MNLDERATYGIITGVALISLIGLLFQQGYLNTDFLFDSSDSEEERIDTSAEMHPLGEECLNTHDVAMHFHPNLIIIIDGEQIVIPTDTGIDTETCPGAMHMTHTHDDTGKIHVEGHQVVDVPLEVFFDVWGVHFDETGIFDYRGGNITMTVDGVESDQYQNLLLEDRQEIIITYESG